MIYVLTIDDFDPITLDDTPTQLYLIGPFENQEDAANWIDENKDSDNEISHCITYIVNVEMPFGLVVRMPW